MRTATSLRFKILVSTATLLLAGLLTSLANAQPREAEGDPEHRGAQTYRYYCQSCHGAEGRGDGPVADSLKHPPPDLTLLSERAGGTFPALRTRRKIDGRDAVIAHGPSDMPVWGLTFELRGDASPGAVHARIDDLVDLLRTWQTVDGGSR